MTQSTAITLAVAEAIHAFTRESALGGVPSGELYQVLMGMIPLSTFNLIISNLKAEGWIRESNNLLSWVPTTK